MTSALGMAHRIRRDRTISTRPPPSRPSRRPVEGQVPLQEGTGRGEFRKGIRAEETGPQVSVDHARRGSQHHLVSGLRQAIGIGAAVIGEAIELREMHMSRRQIAQVRALSGAA